MRISSLKQPLEIEQLSFNGNEIEIIKSYSFWGVWITADFTCNLHVDKITAKASKRTGVNQSHLGSVYCSFVRPTLVCAFPVWHTSLPNYLADIIESFPELSYAESLNKSGLHSLSLRHNLCKKFF